jgi:hypothetical protein
MKEIAFIIVLVTLGLSAVLPSCNQYEPPAQTSCSGFTVVNTALPKQRFDGVDLLVVVDDTDVGGAEEQNILSSGFYTLINSLTRPLSPEIDPEWGYGPVGNMRVTIVTSDMGLQWGGGQTGGNTTDIQKCGNDLGDNGEFQEPSYTEGGAVITVASLQIMCEDGGGQCPTDPAGWDCNADHLCEAPGGVGTVNCPGTRGFAETTAESPDPDFVTEVACMAQQGTEGCTVEQQLEAAVRGIETHPEFVVPTHVLAVLIVTDEADCSIRDNGLFQTDEWMSGASGELMIACNIPENETYLFPANDEDAEAISEAHGVPMEELDTYHDRLVGLKGGQAEAVVFSAIVGVPDGDGSPCQGDGAQLLEQSCLDQAAMQIVVQTFAIEDREFHHFGPACTKEDNGVEVTSARPGRRFVKTAQDFGKNGYIYSICNESWFPAMRDIAEIIARAVNEATCPEEPLEWEAAPTDGCPDCGEATCDVMVAYTRDGADINDPSCPSELYEGLSAKEAESYKSRKEVVEVKENGVVARKTVNCALPKIVVPLDCDLAMDQVDQSSLGWFYCEKKGENFDDACQDGLDNDGDAIPSAGTGPAPGIDCDDEDCAPCAVCGGTGRQCETGCRFNVALTDAARAATVGQVLKLQCAHCFE